MNDKGQSRATFLLFLLFFLGLAVTLSAFIDVHWTHVVIRDPAIARAKQELR